MKNASLTLLGLQQQKAVLFTLLCIGCLFSLSSSFLLHADDKSWIAGESVGQAEALKDGWYSQKVRIRNVSAKSIFVYGHSLDSPFVQIDTRNPETMEWESFGIGYCGTGADLHKVKNGKEFVATIRLPGNLAKQDLRVRLHCYRSKADKKPKEFATGVLRMVSGNVGGK